MKIGIDLRTNLTKNNFLLNEIIDLFLDKISEKFEDYSFNIYLNKNIEIKKDYNNIDFFFLDFLDTSIENQVNFKNLLKEHNNDIVLFFGLGRPIFYKGKNLLIVNNLDNLLYETQEVDNFAKKFKYFFLLEYSCLHTDKIITTNKELGVILNEKVNISEEKILVNYGFFYKKNLEEIEPLVKQKNNFLIYNSGNSKLNLKLIIESLFEYNTKNINKLDLVIVGEDYDNVELRKLALKYDLIDNIKEIENSSKYLKWYYKNAICTIYPSFSEVFPFELNYALSFNSTILAAETSSIKEIFAEKLIYFKASSKLDFLKKLDFVIENRKKYSYEKLFEKYSLDNFIKNLEKLF